MRILIVEDAVMFAKALESILVEAGHEIACAVGFFQLSPTETIAIGLDKQPLPLDFSRFDLALCDGQLEGADGKVDKSIDGSHVVRGLVASGVNCLGMSSENDLNRAMCEAGALLAFNKAVVLLAVMGGRIDVATIAQHAPVLRDQEEQLKEALSADRPLVDRANELLMGRSS